jgi:hypothetical protein
MVKTELTPVKAIRRHCIACSGDTFKGALWCPVTDCTLWQYRLGARPSTVAARYCPELFDPAAQPASDVNFDTLPGGLPGAVAWFEQQRMETEAAVA